MNHYIDHKNMYTVYNCSMYIIGGKMEPESNYYNQVRTLRVQLPVPEIHVKCGGCQKDQTSSLRVDVVTESTTHIL